MKEGQFAVFVSYGLGLRSEERKGFNSYDDAVNYAYQRANEIMLSGKRLFKDKDLHLWTDKDLNKIIRVYNCNFDLV
jgi:hypothetical protein